MPCWEVEWDRGKLSHLPSASQKNSRGVHSLQIKGGLWARNFNKPGIASENISWLRSRAQTRQGLLNAWPPNRWKLTFWGTWSWKAQLSILQQTFEEYLAHLGLENFGVKEKFLCHMCPQEFSTSTRYFTQARRRRVRTISLLSMDLLGNSCVEVIEFT